MQETLAVLPVGHGRAGLHAVVSIAGGHERFVVNHLGRGKAFLQIAIGPVHWRLARHGKLAFISGSKISRSPVQGLQRHAAAVDDVAVAAGAWPARIKALQGIYRKR